MQAMNNKKHIPSFSEPVDAIVLAGTHGDPTRWIQGKNKAFLRVDGRPLVRHMIDALLGARSVADIFVVGPVDQLNEALAGVPDRIRIVEQQGNLLGNGWAGVYASERQRNGDRDVLRPYLAVSSDLPLVSSTALDDFIARCADVDQSADGACGLMIGLADEAGLEPFSETEIVRPYVELEFARTRLANIYIARPRALNNLAFLQTGFGFRKAVNWRNVLGLTFSFLSQQGGMQAAWLTLRLQATLLAARRGGWLYRRLRRWNTRQRVEAYTGKVLGGTVRLVVSPFGGLSLDVDDEDDFRKLAGRYDDWMAIHNAVESEYLPGRSEVDDSG